MYYLLSYIDDETYRRRILTQLNRGEGRHSVARAICHGRRGEIRQRYREGQEDQLSALGGVGHNFGHPCLRCLSLSTWPCRQGYMIYKPLEHVIWL